MNINRNSHNNIIIPCSVEQNQNTRIQDKAKIEESIPITSLWSGRKVHQCVNQTQIPGGNYQAEKFRCIPGNLKFLLTKLPNRYTALSIGTLVNYFNLSSIKNCFKHSTLDNTRLDDIKQIYFNICGTFIELNNRVISKKNLILFEYYESLLSSDKNLTDIPKDLLPAIKKHMESLLGSQLSIRLPEEVSLAWKYRIQNIINNELSTLNQSQISLDEDKDLLFYATLLPSVISSTISSQRFMYRILRTEVEHFLEMAQNLLDSHYSWSPKAKETAYQTVEDYCEGVLNSSWDEGFQLFFYEEEIEPALKVFSDSYLQRLLKTDQYQALRKILEYDQSSFRELISCTLPFFIDFKNDLNTMISGAAMLVPFIGYLVNLSEESILSHQEDLIETFLAQYGVVVEENKISEGQADANDCLLRNVKTSVQSCNEQCSVIIRSIYYHIAHIKNTGLFIQTFDKIFTKKIKDQENKREEEDRNLAPLINKEVKKANKNIARKNRKKAKKAEKNAAKTAFVRDHSPEASLPQKNESSSSLPLQIFELSPLASLNEFLLNGLEAYFTSFKNSFAKQSLLSAIQHYQDLTTELADCPPRNEHAQLAAHINRLIVVANLLVEQLLSAHVLENKNPQTSVERYQYLRHEQMSLLKDAGLNNELTKVLQHFDSLEVYARYLYTANPKESTGAQILHEAEELMKNPSGEVLALLDQTHVLVRHAFQTVADITNVQLSPTILAGIGNITEEKNVQNDTYKKKCAKILELESAISTKYLTSDPANGNLQDAERLLRLVRTRLLRSGLNPRNFYKEIATLTPLAIESLAIALMSRKGLINLNSFDRKSTKHNLMEMLEKLDIVAELQEAEITYLNSARYIHNLARYSPLFDKIGNRDTRKDILTQLTKVSQPDANDNSGWTKVGGEGKKMIAEAAQAIDDLMKKTNSALIILDKLIKAL